MTGTESFNQYMEQLFQYWSGEIKEKELSVNPHFGISKEVDDEMQKDSF